MRITCETLASGQPRPYADTIRHVRIQVEMQNWDRRPEAEKWVPWKGVTEKFLRELLPHMMVGFPTKEPEGWWDTKLDYLKCTDEEKGIWEFHTTTAFTD